MQIRMENWGLHPAGHSPRKNHANHPNQLLLLNNHLIFIFFWLSLEAVLAWAEFGWEAEARLSGVSRCEAVGLLAGARLLCKATAALVEFESIVALTENQLCIAGTRASSITTQQEVYKTVISCPASALFFAFTFYRRQWGFYCFGFFCFN